MLRGLSRQVPWMKENSRIVLASSSPRRQEILRLWGCSHPANFGLQMFATEITGGFLWRFTKFYKIYQCLSKWTFYRPTKLGMGWGGGVMVM
jgi:hypothetical protein